MAYFLFAASACIAIFALFFLFLKDKKPQHYFMAIAFSCLSYILFYFGSSLIALLSYAPLLLHSDICVTLIAAPAIYLIFLSYMKEGKKPVAHYYRYFMFPVLATVCIAAANVFALVFTAPLLLFLNFISDFGFTVYFCLILFRARELTKKKEIVHLREFRVLVGFAAALFFNSLFMLSAYFFYPEIIFNIAAVFYALIVIAFCLASVRMPDYVLGKLHKLNPPQKPQASNPLLRSEEIVAVRKRLETVMERDKLFRNSDLSLKRLAEKVQVTPHQLSWYINSELNMGFSEYVNRFRLEAVKRELLANPDQPILEIAFDNGFGSKTSFNAFFLNAFGVSPRSYRKRHENSGSSPEA